MKYTIDAQGKKVGRVASEAAKILAGKNLTTYTRNTPSHNEVEIINTSKADISQKKMKQDLHASFSGYPSGIKTPTVGYVIEKKGHKELFRIAVKGMLPKNKLQSIMMKHLKITE